MTNKLNNNTNKLKEMTGTTNTLINQLNSNTNMLQEMTGTTNTITNKLNSNINKSKDMTATPNIWLKCCFTSTETVGLLGTGAQDVHLDFHTAPELWPKAC